MQLLNMQGHGRDTHYWAESLSWYSRDRLKHSWIPESAQSLIIADSSSGEKGSVSSIRLTTSQTILASACRGKKQELTQMLQAELETEISGTVHQTIRSKEAVFLRMGFSIHTVWSSWKGKRRMEKGNHKEKDCLCNPPHINKCFYSTDKAVCTARVEFHGSR